MSGTPQSRFAGGLEGWTLLSFVLAPFSTLQEILEAVEGAA